jgi:hypothetical protein
VKHEDSRGGSVAFHVVNLHVTAGTPIECDFWSAGDGWQGFCKTLSITVSGNSFEDAKKNMAAELQGRIERILRCAADCLTETRFRRREGKDDFKPKARWWSKREAPPRRT